MSITMDATVDNGKLKFDQPVALDDQTRVRVTIEVTTTTSDQGAKTEVEVDPFLAVIGIGKSGPSDYSPADEHDRIIYGTKKSQ